MGPKKGGETVKVVVRIRPLSSKELQDGHEGGFLRKYFKTNLRFSGLSGV